MMEAIVRFSVKRIIGQDATTAWDKQLFETTWFEYELQVQNFPGFGQHVSFSGFLKNVPDAETIRSRESGGLSVSGTVERKVAPRYRCKLTVA